MAGLLRGRHCRLCMWDRVAPSGGALGVRCETRSCKREGVLLLGYRLACGEALGKLDSLGLMVNSVRFCRSLLPLSWTTQGPVSDLRTSPTSCRRSRLERVTNARGRNGPTRTTTSRRWEGVGARPEASRRGGSRPWAGQIVTKWIYDRIYIESK